MSMPWHTPLVLMCDLVFAGGGPRLHGQRATVIGAAPATLPTECMRPSQHRIPLDALYAANPRWTQDVNGNAVVTLSISPTICGTLHAFLNVPREAILPGMRLGGVPCIPGDAHVVTGIPCSDTDKLRLVVSPFEGSPALKPRWPILLALQASHDTTKDPDREDDDVDLLAAWDPVNQDRVILVVVRGYICLLEQLYESVQDTTGHVHATAGATTATTITSACVACLLGETQGVQTRALLRGKDFLCMLSTYHYCYCACTLYDGLNSFFTCVVTLLPCRHKCVCIDCQQRLLERKCPLCRTPTTGLLVTSAHQR